MKSLWAAAEVHRLSMKEGARPVDDGPQARCKYIKVRILECMDMP